MKRIIQACTLSVVAILAFGCGGASTPDVGVAPDPVVRFLNASPKSVGLDFYLNDSLVGDQVPYLGSSPTFVGFEPGEYDLRIEERTDPETQWAETFTINRDLNIVVFAVGLITPPNTDLIKRMRPVPINFDRSAPNGNRARLVIVNGYNRADGLDNAPIDFQNPGDNPAVSSKNIAFASGATLNIDSGPQTFVARRAGTEFEVTPQKTFTFGAGKIYAAIVSGIEDDVASPPIITFVELQTK